MAAQHKRRQPGGRTLPWGWRPAACSAFAKPNAAALYSAQVYVSGGSTNGLAPARRQPLNAGFAPQLAAVARKASQTVCEGRSPPPSLTRTSTHGSLVKRGAAMSCRGWDALARTLRQIPNLHFLCSVGVGVDTRH